uniref:Uncharacterized protein n=1 Tax=uncultured Microgenomates bacterium Rifle_16ft_4_minimus_5036 TaxID=1665119 RepID=A0A0H4TCT7_9BACT|nr:hypothetical protein [uncultured Microgenomates bacterium Rifle_16ft_4_minimus_5036]
MNDERLPWYKGQGQNFEDKIKQAQDRRKSWFGSDSNPAKLDQQLMEQSPAAAAATLKNMGWSADDAARMLSSLGVTAFSLTNQEGKPFIRIVEGYNKKGNGVTSVVKDLSWE